VVYSHSYNPASSKCIILDDKNFDEILVGRGPLWVNFYSPECTHCSEMVPIWEKTASSINGASASKVFAKIGKPRENSSVTPEDYTNMEESLTHPMIIGCMDCSKYGEKCNQIAPEMSGFPKFYLIGVNKASGEASVLEYTGERDLESMLHFAKTTTNVEEAVIRQNQAEDEERLVRYKQWADAEPFFERAALTSNTSPGIKTVTPGNFEAFYQASQEEGANLLLVAHGENSSGERWYGAWMDLADRVTKLKGVKTTVGRVQCNNTPRLCFDNEKFGLPERMDIFPIAFLFNKNTPDGLSTQDIHTDKTWHDVATLLGADDIVAALEEASVAPPSAEEQEMFDEL
jgi:hypothetical protein